MQVLLLNLNLNFLPLFRKLYFSAENIVGIYWLGSLAIYLLVLFGFGRFPTLLCTFAAGVSVCNIKQEAEKREQLMGLNGRTLPKCVHACFIQKLSVYVMPNHHWYYMDEHLNVPWVCITMDGLLVC